MCQQIFLKWCSLYLRLVVFLCFGSGKVGHGETERQDKFSCSVEKNLVMILVYYRRACLRLWRNLYLYMFILISLFFVFFYSCIWTDLSLIVYFRALKNFYFRYSMGSFWVLDEMCFVVFVLFTLVLLRVLFVCCLCRNSEWFYVETTRGLTFFQKRLQAVPL